MSGKGLALSILLGLLPCAAQSASPTAAIAQVFTSPVGATSQVATADGSYLYQLAQDQSSFTAFQVTSSKLKKLASYTYNPGGMLAPPSFQSIAIDKVRNLLFAFEISYPNPAAFLINVYRIGSDGKLAEINGSPFPVNGRANNLSNSPMVVDSANGRLFLQTGGSFPFSAQYQCDTSSAIVTFNIGNDDTLTQVSGPTNTVSNAMGFTLTPDGKYVLVAGFNTNNCGLSNSSISGQLVAYPVLATGALGANVISQTIPISVTPISSSAQMVKSPIAVVADPYSNNIYLLNYGQSPFAFSYNGTTGSLTPNTAVTPLNAYALAFSDHGRRAWALNNAQIQAYQVNANGALSAEGSALPSAPSQDSQGLPPSMIVTASSTKVMVTNDSPQTTRVYATNLPAFGATGVSGSSTAITASAPVSNVPAGCTASTSLSTTMPGNDTTPVSGALSATATLSNGVISGALPLASMQLGQAYYVRAGLSCGATGTFFSAPTLFSYAVNLAAPYFSGDMGTAYAYAQGNYPDGSTFALSISTTASTSETTAAPGAISVPLSAAPGQEGLLSLNGAMPVAKLLPNTNYYVRTQIILPNGSTYFSTANTFSMVKAPTVSASFSYTDVFSVQLNLQVNTYALSGTEYGFILTNPANAKQAPITLSFKKSFSGTGNQALPSGVLDVSPTSTQIPYSNGTIYKVKGYAIVGGTTYETAEVDLPVKSPISLAFISTTPGSVTYDFVIDHARLNVNSMLSASIGCTWTLINYPQLEPRKKSAVILNRFDGSMQGAQNTFTGLSLQSNVDCTAVAYMPGDVKIRTDGLTSMQFQTGSSSN